ncbi:TPA: hypothetical protein ACGEYH_000146 [Providencia rettgeri]|uniref:hypothetical protein n=1 Tax=Providencia vermicola TaxID=333965 RepID=UPI0032DBC1E2
MNNKINELLQFAHLTPMTGEDIKRIREQNNISQSSLALILNMTKESLSGKEGRLSLMAWH